MRRGSISFRTSRKQINRAFVGELVEYRRLGNTGAKVSRICLGTNNFGRQLDEQQSTRVIAKAQDLGVNSIDTANVYASSKSEEVIGQAIKGNRNSVFLATKVASEMGSGPNDRGLSRKHILWQISESLRRLQTDYIDLYYMHRFDPDTPLEETLRTLDDLVRLGKVSYLGCSNFTAQQIADANQVCDTLGLAKIVAVQPRYNLVRREAEAEVLPYCAKNNLAVLTYSPLMGGFLTGKYSAERAPPAGSRGAFSKQYWDNMNKPENF